MHCERFDVVVVIYKDPDRDSFLRRPAVVLSDYRHFHSATPHVLLAMITSAAQTPWPLDCPIGDRVSAGLPCPSVIRPKLITLEAGHIQRKLGRLSPVDRIALQHSLWRLLGSPDAMEIPVADAEQHNDQLDLLTVSVREPSTPLPESPANQRPAPQTDQARDNVKAPNGNEESYLSTDALMALLRRGR